MPISTPQRRLSVITLEKLLLDVSMLTNINRKDVVKRALLHNDTSTIPYNIKFSTIVNTRLQEHFKVKNVDDAVGNFIASFSLKRSKDFQYKELDNGCYYDEFGCLWQGTEANIGQIKECPLRKPSLRGYRLPDPGDTTRVMGLEDFIREHHERYISVSIENHTLIERAFNLRGMPQLMMDIYDHPGFVTELLDNILEYAWGIAKQLLNYEVDALKINDDWGDQRGVMLGLDHWQSLIKPRIKELCERIRKQKDVDIFLHSDGNISEIIPDIIEMGITAIDPMQPEVMNIFELKKQYGKDITFIGGMSTQNTMPFGTPNDIISEVRKLVRELGKGGGYILTPGIIVQEDVPMENILAFINVCKEQLFS